jgi:class 3 adenylate cyclase
MEPPIQYAKTSDGVSIAYGVFGNGPPVVIASNIWGDLNLISSGLAQFRVVVDGLLSQGRRVIAYDGRGMGSSERAATDFSLEARMRDLDAVRDRLDLERFALLGRDHGAPTALAYAVDHPDQVSHIILFEAYVRGADFYGTVPFLRAVRSMREMAEDQWDLFTMTLGGLITEFADVDQAKRSAERFKAGMDAKSFFALLDASNQFDLESLLPSVSQPTLVVHRPSFPVGSLEQSQALAASIPEAQLVASDSPERAIDEFLGQVDRSPAPLPSGTAIILFADIVDSTALTERLGDAAFRAKARDLDATLRAIIRDQSGTPIDGKLLGDGVLAVFTSARQAIEAAIACARCGDDAGLPLHLGLHAGDVIREENNVYGGAVNIAARISGLSAPGEVLVSHTVRDLARTSAGVAFEDRGEQSLKGVGEPVRVWAVVEAE